MSYSAEQSAFEQPLLNLSDTDIPWVSTAPKFMTASLVGGAAATLVSTVVCAIPLIISTIFNLNWLPWLIWGLPALMLIGGLIDLALIPRRVRARAYAQMPDHLLIKYGVLSRKMIAVPYGRLQYVEMNVGPVDRIYGLATLNFHTAANGNDAIKGITEDDAKRLREELTREGTEKMVDL